MQEDRADCFCLVKYWRSAGDYIMLLHHNILLWHPATDMQHCMPLYPLMHMQMRLGLQSKPLDI